MSNDNEYNGVTIGCATLIAMVVTAIMAVGCSFILLAAIWNWVIG